MKTIRCNACGQILTNPLRLVPGDFVAEYEDAQDVVELGQVMVADDSYATRLGECYVTNIDDAISTRYHPDKSRLQGCCGYSDSEGPNLVCECGIEVGSEMSDCWVPRMSYFSSIVTELTNSEQNAAEQPASRPAVTNK